MLKFKRIFAVLIGLVFLFSGGVKLIDPVGTGLIMHEYFSWMGLAFLYPAATYLGSALSLVESFVGLMLICGKWRRLSAILAVVLIVFFTLVSIALVIFNPVMDCGCFGEFIHLTHFQTLIKNIVLCVMAVFAFTPLWYLGFSEKQRIPAFAITSAMLLFVWGYSWFTIPYFDFTDYKPSNTLLAEDDPGHSDVTASLFVKDDYDDDMSYLLLEDDIALISVYDPSALSDKKRQELAKFAASAWNQGFTPYVLCTEDIDIPGVECYLSDYKSIITLNRSNGGVTMLSDGYIYSKCSVNNLYSPKKLAGFAQSDKVDVYVHESTFRAISFQIFCIIFFLIICL